jgi:hypothetical protein
MAKLIIIEHCKQCPFNGNNIEALLEQIALNDTELNDLNTGGLCLKSNNAYPLDHGIHKECPLEDINIESIQTLKSLTNEN